MTAATPRAWAMTPRSWAIHALGLVAGYADAASYLGLGRVFAANMTGNTVLLGIALIGWLGGRTLLPGTPLRPGLALAAFAVGTLGAAVLLRAVRWRTGYRLALLLEAGLLAAVAAGWTAGGPRPAAWLTALLIGVLAAGMGVQSAVANRVGIGGVPTTVVTSSMVVALVRAVNRRRPGMPAVAWAVYLVGGAGGAVGTELLGSAVLWPASAVLAALAATAAESGDTAPAD
jgi:uncharacterized membrane protein YoaK (UPF0700 family)